MAKSLMMLVNPAAGRSMSDLNLGTAVSTFALNGYCPTVFYTTAPGTASKIVEENAANYERLVCLGGDGTLSDTIAGLMTLPQEKRPKLGYIPMGTANDVANTLGLPMRQPGRAAEMILAGTPLHYDVGEMDGVGFFTYIAAFGAFTEVSYKTDQELKRTLGHLAYVLGGLNALSTIKSYKAVIEHENGVVEGEFIYGAMSNSLSVAGMVRLNDDLVDLSDGKFEILLVRRPKDVMEVNSILTGVLSKTYDSPCLTVAQSSFVKVTFEEPVPWTRDGEDGGAHRTLTLRSHRHAVDIYC